MSKSKVRHIEWHELDKRKYYVIGPTIMMGVRLVVFPPTLIKTRLQMQKLNSQYSGTFDAFKKIYKYEGVRGFYKGFATNMFTIVSGQVYITTFEIVRSSLPDINHSGKSLIAGFSASLAGQTITIPVDIISQKQMMAGQRVVPAEVAKLRNKQFKSSLSVVKDIYKADGIRGFYKGYLASLLTYTPSSGIWWASYYTATQLIDQLTPNTTSHLLIQGCSGLCASIVASILTNPADIVRTRLQLEGGNASIRSVIKRLHKEEGFRALHKGITARLMSSVPTGCIIAVSYELVKRTSLKEEYR